MRLVATLLVGLMAGTFTGTALAQPAAGPGKQGQKESAQPSAIGPEVWHNMVSMEKMMREIHLLMHQGLFTPRQATEVTDMMTRLDIMMHEMGGPQGEKLARQHEQELQEMRRRIEIIKQQMKNQ